jgi:hypothetical protein
MNSATIANLKNELREVKAALKRLGSQAGEAQRLDVSAGKKWDRLMARAETLKNEIVNAERAVAVPAGAAEGAVHAALGRVHSKPVRETATGGLARGIRTAIERAHAKRVR